MRVPRARSGAFANVYKLTSGSRTIAVRVFLYPEKEREGRYHAITDHLSAQRPPCIVAFNYSAEGIRVGGGWFPLVTMDWVSGVSLGNWVHDRVYAGKADALLQMAERWGKLLEDLRTANIAHGDLQHDNVMVVGNEPVLVDYDCTCVPALVGRQQLENGKPAYQHPLRKQRRGQLDREEPEAGPQGIRGHAPDQVLDGQGPDHGGREGQDVRVQEEVSAALPATGQG